MKRRQFVGTITNSSLFLLAGGFSSFISPNRNLSSEEFAFVEAEQFSTYGGWDLDQQSMDQMGSPYLLAHGLGIPVADAVTTVNFPSPGNYRVWVRTKDWVAPWNAPGAPGKFQLIINNEPLAEIFGTKSATWHWHDGGVVNVPSKATVALHDLTGFEGRCEAILFCKDVNFKPVNDIEALTKFRRKLLGLPDKPDDGGSYDMVVTGGGLAGTCAAISAARNGLKVALVQDRPVLGGNGSSEVRVWPEGHTNKKPYRHIGDIVNEILPPIKKRKGQVLNGVDSKYYDDALKLKVVQDEPNITLFINHRAINVKTKKDLIHSITIQSTTSARQKTLRAELFADCTGDATIGYKAGADYEYEIKNLMGSSNLFSVLDASNPEEVLACECKDKSALAMKCEIGNVEQPFPRCPWALDLSDKPFPGRKGVKTFGREGLDGFANKWYWESGFNQDQINDIELIRDHNFRAMYGAWDALKNVDGMYPNHRLGWSAFIAGKRESRRLLGDVILDASDFKDRRKFNDPAFPCSWHVDIHSPNKAYQKDFEGHEFVSDFTRGKDYEYGGLFWAPYRTLYSRNIKNLFMAGRDISVTKSGLGPVRVMRTTGMMGEVVGKAASICIKKNTSPRGVYENHLSELKKLMSKPGSYRS
ncbi:FAD-dependent oxidoreductase [Aestuariibaculum sediminum]|uniref:FAD-dependent oxidoreductase n=1 Tax=Aestuariibaculum sediminum TaxID=2770637 RepID=A0A8J6Q256_9FLAO|nr:FAD-dependent oxidoreductase [Aestuariibaculum sediminum]MBD0831580.1 FAD-dependent oxidoreductase [Aestuariibaculum sediminum]